MCGLPQIICDQGNDPIPAAESQKPLLALVASDRFKDELCETVARHWDSLSSKFHLIATKGTYEKLTGKLGGRKESFAGSLGELPPGSEGGILEVAYRVVLGVCRVVAAFADPEDPMLLRADNRALRRVCVVKGAEILHNTASLERYIQAAGDTGLTIPSQTRALSATLMDHPDWLRPHNAEIGTLALISHDEKKPDMVGFAMTYRTQLAEYVRKGGRILATGTTGGLVEKYAKVPIVRYESGPRGGDVQITHEVRNGRCNGVIFFIDPLSAHPHIEDIYALVEAPPSFCPISTEFKSAERLLAELQIAPQIP